MLRSIAAGSTTTLDDVDFANMAPLAASYAVAAAAQVAAAPAAESTPAVLPCEQASAAADFRKAGLSVRASGPLYVIVGISNGGVVKAFDRHTGASLLDDGGYFAEIGGTAVSSQVTDLRRGAEISGNSIACSVEFAPLKTLVTTPFRFTLLRLLNLTLMRNITVGNLVKKLLVRLLITAESAVPLRLRRVVSIDGDEVTVSDELTKSGGAAVTRLERGVPFVSIHMASARYFSGHHRDRRPVAVDPGELNASGRSLQTWRGRAAVDAR
jgi:hypothetical protein